MFCFGMVLHCLLDGLAVGVFQNINEIAIIAVSFIIHRIPESFAVGAAFKSNNQDPKKWSSIVFFILYVTMTPIGILIGSIVGSSGGIGFIILLGLAGGIFIYMSCCHLIIHEFHDSSDINPMDTRTDEEKLKTQRIISLIKFFIVMLGFIVVLAIVSVDNQHHHEH